MRLKMFMYHCYIFHSLYDSYHINDIQWLIYEHLCIQWF